MTHHLLAAISSHGFGHLAQVAPVLNAFDELINQGQAPSFKLTVRSLLPKQQIAWRIQRAFQLDVGNDDFGMVMHDALRVDLVQSLKRYAALHQHWEREVDKLADHLQGLKLTGLLADAPYLTLAAAQAAKIPSVAICSLNWADILERCVHDNPQALKQADVSPAFLARMLQHMRDAYGSAKVVLSPAPAIQASGFQTVPIEPLAEQASPANRAGLLSWVQSQATDYLSGHPDCWLVLTSMGGIHLPMHATHWPTRILNRPVIYLTDPNMASDCPHTVGFDLNQFAFSALMASCDLVLTKPGYGMFVESRVCGKPMLYLEREQWPESDCLMQWASEHTNAYPLSLQQLAKGDFALELQACLKEPALAPVKFLGAQQAAEHLVGALLAA